MSSNDASAAEQDQAPLLVLSGPTAVGKSSAAMALCRLLGGEIVSADSVQVYRGLDVGSSKPSLQERQAVAHHLIDLVEPGERLDAAQFASLADSSIAALRRADRLPVVVGGTNLWLRALLRGLVEVPEVDTALRTELEAQWEQRGPETMHARLAQVDPYSARTIHPNDKLRVVRALEVHAQTGRALGQLRRDHAHGAPRYTAVHVHLDLPAAHWEGRLERRLDEMLARGWVDEVRGLVGHHGADAPALRSVGYRQIVQQPDATARTPELRVAIRKATRIFGRRQRTWLRSDTTVDRRTTPAELLTPESVQELARQLRRDLSGG